MGSTATPRLNIRRAAIEQLRRESTDIRARAVADFRADLDTMTVSNPDVATVKDRIVDRVEAGDLATAWEYVSLAKKGAALPGVATTSVGVEQFFPELDDQIAKDVKLSQRSVAETARNGGQVGPLSFQWLDGYDRDIAAAGFAAWRELGLVKQPSKDQGWERDLPAVLAVLGLTAQRIDRHEVQGAHDPDRCWIDLIGWITTGDPVVRIRTRPRGTPHPEAATHRRAARPRHRRLSCRRDRFRGLGHRSTPRPARLRETPGDLEKVSGVPTTR